MDEITAGQFAALEALVLSAVEMALTASIKDVGTLQAACGAIQTAMIHRAEELAHQPEVAHAALIYADHYGASWPPGCKGVSSITL
jgi:hypothetical protein